MTQTPIQLFLHRFDVSTCGARDDYVYTHVDVDIAADVDVDAHVDRTCCYKSGYTLSVDMDRHK